MSAQVVMRICSVLSIYLLLSSITLVSCGGPNRPVLELSISLRNDTPLALDHMEIEWDGPDVPGGIMPAGNEKMAMDVLPPRSDVATINFVENVTRQPHSIRVDVSRIRALRSGEHYVVIAVTSLDEARVFVNAQPWKSNRQGN